MNNHQSESAPSAQRTTRQAHPASPGFSGRTEQAGPTQPESWILRTLLHTPLLRVADLRACTGLSQASLYRLLHHLQVQAWIEAVVPSALGLRASACYYLTERGLSLVASQLGVRPAAVARVMGADERGLLRLLPRLGSLVRVQEILWDLCLSAPEYLTVHGQRSAIAWHWLRDYTYRWHDEAGHSHTYTVSALLILRRRPVVAHYPDALREEAAQHEARAQEVWYAMQVLCDHPLLDGDAIVRWLQRLCLARAACAPGPFPPVLIVVEAPERSALWHAALRHLTETHPSLQLSAVLSVVPADLLPSRQPGAIWRLSWHDLLTQAPCHLQDALAAGTVESVPPGALASLDPIPPQERQESVAPMLQEGTPSFQSAAGYVARRSHLPALVQGRFAQRLSQAQRRQQLQTLVLPLACLHLSERTIKVPIQVERTPGASSEELAAWEGLSASSVARTMMQLRREGWVLSAGPLLAPSVPDRKKRWVLTERGTSALAHLFPRPHAPQRIAHSLPTPSGDTLLVPGRAARLLHRHVWPHQQGLYHFFARLAQAAPPIGDASPKLVWWSEMLGTRHYRWNGVACLLQPDATAEVASGERVVRFWLEYAAGDPSVRDLARTLTSYATYLRSRDWMREQRPLPLLCYLVEGPAAEQRLARLIQRWQAPLAGCRIAVTTMGRVAHAGVLAPIWWPLALPVPGAKPAPAHQQTVPLQRVGLLDL